MTPMGPIQKEMVRIERRAISRLKQTIGRNIREIIRREREDRDAEILRQEVARQKRNLSEQVAEVKSLIQKRFDGQPPLRGTIRGVEKLRAWRA